MADIDALDEKLIKLLQKDARQSSEALAKQLKVSSATVRRRTRNLLQDGVVRIMAVADPQRVGLPVTAVIGLDVTHDKLDSVMDVLSNRTEVIWLSTTTGRFDITAVARFASTDEIYTFMQQELANIEALKDSETLICLHVKKAPHML